MIDTFFTILGIVFILLILTEGVISFCTAAPVAKTKKEKTHARPALSPDRGGLFRTGSRVHTRL
jgi:hypothetical protein